MSRPAGPIRIMLNQIAAISKESGLTYEQVADFLDVLGKLQNGDTGTNLRDIATKGRVQ